MHSTTAFMALTAVEIGFTVNNRRLGIGIVVNCEKRSVSWTDYLPQVRTELFLPHFCQVREIHERKVRDGEILFLLYN